MLFGKGIKSLINYEFRSKLLKNKDIKIYFVFFINRKK
jgi:hypothetical protein